MAVSTRYLHKQVVGPCSVGNLLDFVVETVVSVYEFMKKHRAKTNNAHSRRFVN